MNDPKKGVSSDQAVDDLFKNTNYPEELKDDKDFVADLKAIKKEEPPAAPADAPAGGDDLPKPPETPKPKEEPKYESGKEMTFKENDKAAAQDVVVDKVNEDGTYNIKVGDKVIENVKKEQLVPPADPVYEFESDVTIDDITFKKDVLKKTPVEVLENIGRLTERIKDLSGTTAAKEALFNDPIIKERIQRIEAGEAEKPYSIYGMSKQTAEALKEKLELTDEELKVVYDQFNADMEDNVRKVISTEKAKGIQETRVKEDAQRGMNVLLALGDINPAFKIKETNLEKLWTMKEKHPEWNTFSNGIGKFQKHLIEKFSMTRYGEVTKFTPKALYAMVAADLDMPVVINSKGRDEKIRQSERDRLMSIFSPKKVAGIMRGENDETSKRRATIDDDGAISKTAFNDDPNYYDNLLATAKTDEDIFKIQGMMKAVLK